MTAAKEPQASSRVNSPSLPSPLGMGPPIVLRLINDWGIGKDGSPVGDCKKELYLTLPQFKLGVCKIALSILPFWELAYANGC